MVLSSANTPLTSKPPAFSLGPPVQLSQLITITIFTVFTIFITSGNAFPPNPGLSQGLHPASTSLVPLHFLSSCPSSPAAIGTPESPASTGHALAITLTHGLWPHATLSQHKPKLLPNPPVAPIVHLSLPHSLS